MLKGIPIGREDFRDIRENNLYYIDKTKFIEDILLDGTQVKLFCRPRRFGKTLNMSTLKYFFDIKDKEKNRKLFDGLYIENSPLIKEQGKYPVIFISMKGITGLSWKESFSEIKLKVKELFRDYSSLVDKFDKYDKGDFEKYILD
ncbi:MAG: AAA family ATPase, partial [Fusobacterium mortiferum]